MLPTMLIATRFARLSIAIWDICSSMRGCKRKHSLLSVWHIKPTVLNTIPYRWLLTFVISPTSIVPEKLTTAALSSSSRHLGWQRVTRCSLPASTASWQAIIFGTSNMLRPSRCFCQQSPRIPTMPVCDLWQPTSIVILARVTQPCSTACRYSMKKRLYIGRWDIVGWPTCCYKKAALKKLHAICSNTNSSPIP